jgi:hypothetical protein
MAVKLCEALSKTERRCSSDELNWKRWKETDTFIPSSSSTV